MNERARALWARTRIHVWPECYLLASLPVARLSETAALVARAGDAFVALVRERDEVSLTVPEALRSSLEPLAAHIAGPYRILTFDLSLELDVIGYMAPALERLAAAGVSIVPQCGHRTDHLLVFERDLEAAVGALEALIRESALD
ncbi:MAG TPA: ACT domain-containing protein [Vicinamibacteria bacterium]|nr:ACT domain-containing protein [Vicinamibacteria bacterium]